MKTQPRKWGVHIMVILFITILCSIVFFFYPNGIGVAAVTLGFLYILMLIFDLGFKGSIYKRSNGGKMAHNKKDDRLFDIGILFVGTLYGLGFGLVGNLLSTFVWEWINGRFPGHILLVLAIFTVIITFWFLRYGLNQMRKENYDEISNRLDSIEKSLSEIKEKIEVKTD